MSARKSKRRVAQFKRAVDKHQLSNADRIAKENIATQMKHVLRPMKAIERTLREAVACRKHEMKKKKKMGVAYKTKKYFLSTKSEAGLRAAYDLLDRRAKVVAAAATKGWAVAARYAQKIQ